jgi:hypothetical protein
MANQSISAHVVVISQGNGKLPDTKANSLPDADSGADFANLLAAQIQGDTKVPVITEAANPGQAPLAEADKPAKKPAHEADSDPVAAISNDPQAADQLINTLNSLQVPQLQGVQADTHIKVSSEKSEAVSLESNLGAKSISATELLPSLDKTATPAAAAKETIDPAKIAVSDKTLPLDSLRDIKDIKVDTSNQSSVSQINPAHLTQVNRTIALPANAAPITPPAVQIPVGHAGWDTEFSQRVAWVATNTQQVAHLQLNPPNLGPMEIRISLSSDQTNAAFTSPHAAVRDAIEAALPRLREMLADNGLSLGNVNVSSQSFQQQQQQQSQTGQGNNPRYDPFQELHRITASAGSAGFSSQGVATITHVNNGLVDIFA